MATAPDPDASMVRALTIDPTNPDAVIGGEFIGDWLEVDVSRVKAFDHATFTTENAVPMAIDLYPKGLVEGFNSIGLLDRLHDPVFRVAPTDSAPGGWRSRLHAIEKVRWTSRIEAGQSMRARGTVTGAAPLGDGFVLALDVVVEVEGREKPGLVTKWSQLWRPVADKSSRPGSAPLEGECAPTEGLGEDMLVLTTPFEEVPTMAGQPFRGGWLAVDEARHREWAYCTSAVGDPDDEDDPDDGVLAPAHLLALLDHLCNRVVNVAPGPWFGWNYGLDDVVFTSDVRVGERVRLVGSVASVERRGEGFVPCFDVVLEAEGRTKPVLTAQWRAMWLPPEDHS